MEEKRKQDRRRNRRVTRPVPILVFWNGKTGRHAADVCDVSPEGCYLNTSGEADAGDFVIVEFPLSVFPERIVKIGGKVIPQPRKFTGFGVRFDGLTDEQHSYITRLMVRSEQVKDRRSSRPAK